jgi:aminopeptidase YwaD
VIVRVVAGLVVGLAMMSGCEARAQKPPLLPERDVATLANELSGETAKRNLEAIATFHRQRGSKGFHSAADLVAERLRAYGLSDVAILEFAADGKIFYGTQRSRPAWDAEKGELTEMTGMESVPCRLQSSSPPGVGIAADCFLVKGRLIASYEAEPVVLAEDSGSAEVTAELVDVGEGTKESDYASKDVKGKIVLAGAQPGAVQDLAVGKFGAAGIVSYAQNQKTAWSGEDENLIRWGHLETFSANKTFAFMVSLKTARGMRERLARGEKISLQAMVKAGQHAGNYEVVTAAIPGTDAKLKEEEIAFSCHLDHQRPGANDNASGCVTILEVARTLQKLIDEKKLERPARTLRFIFPPEVEGTMALLNGRPEFAKRIKAVIHMDMVGGGPETKAVFHVTRGPMSLPSFVHDVAWAFAEWVNEESYKFAATGTAEHPMVAPEGGKEPLRAEYAAYTMGSDHDVYQDSSFGIPAIYLNDWPDRYIHTNFDTAANIDTTKLKRAAFIGGASGYFLAKLRDSRSRGLLIKEQQRSYERVSLALAQRAAIPESARFADMRGRIAYETMLADSYKEFLTSKMVEDERIYEGIALMDHAINTSKTTRPEPTGDAARKFRRNLRIKGPLTVFGYDYFAENARTAGLSTPKLLGYEGLWGAGEEYAYEVLNLADGNRNTQEICDAVSAEYGPVPIDLVTEYLDALVKISVVEKVE